jgi:hypothetical protein
MKMSKSVDEIVVPAIKQRTLPVYTASGTELAMGAKLHRIYRKLGLQLRPRRKRGVRYAGGKTNDGRNQWRSARVEHATS